MTLDQLTAAIFNNVQSGLRGMNINMPYTLEQIEDGVTQERMLVIRDYGRQNLIPLKDLMYSIRCIEVDCEALDRCPCDDASELDKIKHIELPQIMTEFGENSIGFIGSTDGLKEYKVYTDESYRQHKHKRRGADKPYVWIDTTPNKNNKYDGFIFGGNMHAKQLLVRVIPKDLRQLADYNCCNEEIYNINFIDTEIEKRLTEKYIRYYRQMAMPITPNDQTIKA